MKQFILMSAEKNYLVEKANKQFSTQFGQIDLSKLKAGKKIKTHMGHEFYAADASFIDCFNRLKRGPQVILKKDIGAIIANTGVSIGWKVVDAGTGSGWLSAYLANIVGETGKIVTYERKEEFAKIAKSNFEFLNLNNITVKNKDIYNGISEKKIDLITLDLPEPSLVIAHAKKALKSGGFLVAYLPNTTQVQKFCADLKKEKEFALAKVVEVIEREWKVEGEICRPEHQMLGHTAFLIFVRKIA